MKRPGIAQQAERLRFDTVIDVRSEDEFADDHLPGAINLPVLNNEERARVGTLYKQISPFEAKKLGAALVSANIARHLLAQCQGYPKGWRPLVYCWRGGQRSGSFTTVLRQIGWDACQLEGGYKAYRREVVEQLATLPSTFSYRVIAGATGSAKTRLLHCLKEQGAQVLDLEGLACHKGSVLGRHPDEKQPPQKLFESSLLQKLRGFSPDKPVWVEAESRKIGCLHLPEALIENMRRGQSFVIEAPLEQRIAFLLQDYHYVQDRAEWITARLEALRSLRGNETVDQWQYLAKTGNFPSLVEKLLSEHYDPLYSRSQAQNYRVEHQTDAGQVLHAPDLSKAGLQKLATLLLSKHETGLYSK